MSDVSRPEIARRVIGKEILRRAFRGIDVPAGGDNVHGEFDDVEEWPAHRPVVAAWIADHPQELESICSAILGGPPWTRLPGEHRWRTTCAVT